MPPKQQQHQRPRLQPASASCPPIRRRKSLPASPNSSC